MNNLKNAIAAVAVLMAVAPVYGQRTGTRSNNRANTNNNTATPPSNVITVTANGVSFKMVKVQGGTFTMGATSEQGTNVYSNEKPAHSVTLGDYYIGQTEVTQELWKAVMGNNPSKFAPIQTNSSRCSYDAFVEDAKKLNQRKPGTVRIPTREEWDATMISTKGSLLRPVEQVSWNDCQTFIRKLNSITGKSFRLPTEAEWEFAARGGNKSNHYKYSGSNNIGDVAWYYKNAYDVGSNSPNYGTHPVGTKSANELGIYDMSGNVWEWCSDWYGNYSSSSQTNPQGPSSGSDRVIRGGSWCNDRGCRVSLRYFAAPDIRFDFLGLRLAL